MAVSDSIFVELDFFLLLGGSLVLPIIIYCYMLRKRAISRLAVAAFGVCLVAIAGINVVVLKHLADAASRTPSLLDDRLFSSEISVALYLFPALFAGVGINMISHVLIRHLGEAERRYEREH